MTGNLRAHMDAYKGKGRWHGNNCPITTSLHHRMGILFYLFFSVLMVSDSLFDLQMATAHTLKGSTKIGGIVDDRSRVGKEQKVAMEMAIEDFNSQHPNLHVELLMNSSNGEPIKAALAARELVDRHGVNAILGLQSWEEASLVVEIGSQAHTPVLSLAYATPDWATQRWPFLLQASPDQSAQMKAIAAVIESQHWHRVTAIYEDGPSSLAGAILRLSEALKDSGVEIGHLLPLPPLASSTSLEEELRRLKEGQCRVFVVHTSLQLGLGLFEVAGKMEMMGEGYVWIITDTMASLVHSIKGSTISSSMEGIVGISSYFNETTPKFKEFSRRFRRKFIIEHLEEEKNEPGIYAATAYDAAMAAALALKRGSMREGQELLKEISNIKFDGLTGNVEFHGQKLPPGHTFQIINLVGRSDRTLGLWSAMKTKPTESGLGCLAKVVWPGAPRDTPRGWTTPTHEKPLNIGVPTMSSFKQFVEVVGDGDNLSFKGFSMEVFEAATKHLPYALTLKFHPFNGTYDELVRKVYLKEYDAVVGDVAIVAKRFEDADFTQPYAEPGLVMITPVKSISNSNKAWLFMKPFTKAMWALTTFITVYNGFVVWLIERNHCSELKGSVLNQIGTLLWLAFTTLFSVHGEKLHSNLSRVAMVVWLFVALVITQSYTANLTSMLTVSKLEPTVTDIETLKSSNSMIGYCRGSFVKAYLKDVLGFDEKNIKNFSSPEGYAEALSSKEIAAAFLEVPFAKLLLAKYCKRFIEAGPTYQVGGFGFVFPRGSPLVQDVSRALLNVSESGELRRLKKSMLSSEECVDEESEDDGDETSSLSPSSFWVLFAITGGTSTFALISFILHHKLNNFRDPTSGPRNIWRFFTAMRKLWLHRTRRFSRRVSDVELSRTSPIAAIEA